MSFKQHNNEEYMAPLRELTNLEDRLLKEMDEQLATRVRNEKMTPSTLHALVARNIQFLKDAGYVATPAGVFMTIVPDILDGDPDIEWINYTHQVLQRIMEKKRAED